jgi:hypothetical protein
MLLDVDTRRLLGLKYELVYCFELVAEMVEGGIMEFVNDVDRPSFVKREVMEFGVDGLLLLLSMLLINWSKVLWKILMFD